VSSEGTVSLPAGYRDINSGHAPFVPSASQPEGRCDSKSEQLQIGWRAGGEGGLHIRTKRF
jgi:hypothetical protein